LLPSAARFDGSRGRPIACESIHKYQLVTRPSDGGTERVDAADQSAREKQGYGDGLTQALSLVVGPLIFGLLGAFIDSKLGTSPVFLLVLGFLGLIAAGVTAFFEYRERMARHDQGKPWARHLQ